MELDLDLKSLVISILVVGGGAVCNFRLGFGFLVLCSVTWHLVIMIISKTWKFTTQIKRHLTCRQCITSQVTFFLERGKNNGRRQKTQRKKSEMHNMDRKFC